jgi:hypothetical protein
MTELARKTNFIKMNSLSTLYVELYRCSMNDKKHIFLLKERIVFLRKLESDSLKNEGRRSLVPNGYA